MRQLAVLLCALVCALALAHALPASAQGTLDQSNTGGDQFPAFFPAGPLGDGSYAQSFTAGITGTMDAASVAAGAPVSGETITVSIYATNGSGLPTGPALAAGTLPLPVVPSPPPVPLTTVTFTPGAQVVAGTTYALVFSDLQPSTAIAALAFSSTNTYPRGAAEFSPTGALSDFIPVPVDFYFQTFVTPTPTVHFVFVTGLTVQISGCGTVSPPSPIVVAFPGQSVVVTAVPCPGSTFTGWGGGPCDGTRINPCDIVVASTQLVTANFSP